MSTSPPNGQLPVEAALAAAGDQADEHGQQTVLRAIASAELLVPQADAPDSPDDGGAVSLPVIEQEGTQFVPAFTSETRLAAAAPDVGRYISVPAAQLGAAWPEDELWLAVNPGSTDSATLSPETVRALPDLHH